MKAYEGPELPKSKIAVISNCPQINNPVNDYNPTPIRVIIWKPDQAVS